MQPRAERPAPVEPVEPADRGQKGLLRDVLRCGGVVHHEIGRAVGASNRLRFIEEIRKRVTGALRLLPHFFRTVIGIIHHVVGTDPDDRHAARLKTFRHLRHACLHVLYVRAMIADKHHEQRGRVCEVSE